METTIMSTEEKDAQLRRSFRKIPPLDATLASLIRELAPRGHEGFVPSVLLCGTFAAKHGGKLNDVLAQALGVPAFPGLASRYLRMNDTFEARGEGTELMFRVRGDAPAPAPAPATTGTQPRPAPFADVDTLVRERFREDMRLDAQIEAILQESPDRDEQGFMPVVKLASAFQARYGIRIAQAVAKVLGLATLPGLPIRYLRAHPRFEVKAVDATNPLCRLREAPVAPQVGQPRQESQAPAQNPLFLTNRDELVKTHFREVPELDARIAQALASSHDADNDGFVPAVQLGAAFRMAFAQSLNDAVAQALGLPSFPGLASRYLRLNPRFESTGERETIAFRVGRTASATGLTAPTVAEGAKTDVSLPDWLEHFAFILWEPLLERLERLALPEDWGPGREILKSKILYTFMWLARRYNEAKSPEEKHRYLYFDQQDGCAIMNVGLVDRAFKEIYVIFTRNKNPNTQAWFANEQSVASVASENRGGAIRLSRLEDKLPRWPRFLDSACLPTLFADLPIRVPQNHLLEHLERFPESVLRRLCRDDEIVAHLLEQTLDKRGGYRLNEAEQEELFEPFKAAFQGSDLCRNTFEVALDAAVKRTRQRIKWNYKTVVPAYYPKRDTINPLVPLSFGMASLSASDVALVLSYDAKHKCYLGMTILSNAMAYKNARLICRPNAEWLDSTRL